MPKGKQSAAPRGRNNQGSPVQDAVAKVAMDPKLSYDAIAKKVRAMVKDCATSPKSVASLVMRLRKQGVRIPARERPAQGTHAHA